MCAAPNQNNNTNMTHQFNGDAPIRVALKFYAETMDGTNLPESVPKSVSTNLYTNTTVLNETFVNRLVGLGVEHTISTILKLLDKETATKVENVIMGVSSDIDIPQLDRN